MPTLEDLFGPIPQEVLNELSSEEQLRNAIEANAEDTGELDLDEG